MKATKNKTTVNATLKDIPPELADLLEQFPDYGSYSTYHCSRGSDTLTIRMKASLGSIVVKR